MDTPLTHVELFDLKTYLSELGELHAAIPCSAIECSGDKSLRDFFAEHGMAA